MREHGINYSDHLTKIPTLRIRLNWLCLSLATGAALLGAPTRIHAQGTTPTSDYTNTFDTASSTASWIYWYGLGYNNTAMTWDGTMDAQNNLNSGSLMVSAPFGTNGDQAVWFGTFHNQGGYDGATIYDGTKFTNITFDVHVDTSSPVSASGDFGVLQVGLVEQGWANGGTFYGNSPTIPGSASNGWAHLDQVVDQTTVGLDAVAGVDFKYTSYGGYPKAPITFWIDNLQVHLAPFKPAPPALAAPYGTIHGLNLFSGSGNGDQYQRTNLRLQDNLDTGWLGASAPVTYSFTITNFPDPVKYPGYQAHIFLVTGASIPSYETAPDYAETNLIFVQVQQNADGTGVAYFRYKINEPNQNTNVFTTPPYLGPGPAHAGTLLGLSAPTVLGTWSLTFNQDTNVTLAGPGGASTNFSILTETAQAFVAPINVLFGAQPNSPANFGQAVVLAAASVSGIGTPVSDDFMTDPSLDTVTWAILSGDVNSVQLIPDDPGARWVKWSLPDSGFGLQTTTNVGNPSSWTTLTGPDATVGPLTSFASSGSRFVLVPSSVQGSEQNYFRLDQQTFTKLQVLMPGETAAPGTPLGKTGAPVPETAGVPFQITVNAVDYNWAVMTTVTDVVHLSSSDGTATLDPDTALFAGTATFNVTFNTSGTFTVTASDVTDATKTANTGSPTSVP